MIETRNATNTMVLSRSGINIFNISDLLLQKKSFDFLQKRFPVSKEEIFAVIDCVADTRSKHVEGDIEFIDRGEEGMVSLETISISEGMYFNIINFGRIWHPGQDNLDFLYEKGLAYLLIEIFTDINNNTTTYQDSDIHDIIYHAVNFAVGPINDPNFILSGLPVEEYNELRYEAT